MISKETLILHCQTILNEKISVLKNELENIKDSTENEDKNSSGDKFETGHAMLHQQKEKIMVQMVDFLEMKNTIDHIEATKISKQVEIGSLIKTTALDFFLSVHLGKIVIDNEIIFALSVKSPIGQQLMHKKVNDEFIFKNESHRILEIY